MDKEFGIRIATNWCTSCERKGSPAVVWDSGGKVLKYLHFSPGVSTAFTRARKIILSAELDMPPELKAAALEGADLEGLDVAIPQEQLGQFPPAAATETHGTNASSTAMVSELQSTRSILEEVAGSKGQTQNATPENRARHKRSGVAYQWNVCLN